MIVAIVTACRDLPYSDDLIHAMERGEDGEFLEWVLKLCAELPFGAAGQILHGRTLFDQYQEIR